MQISSNQNFTFTRTQFPDENNSKYNKALNQFYINNIPIFKYMFATFKGYQNKFFL